MSGPADSSRGGDRKRADEPFDELDATRRFPSEDEWLDLPMPSAEELGGASPSSRTPSSITPSSITPSSRTPSGDSAGGVDSFVDRVMRARKEEVQAERELEALDGALPQDLLRQFEAPEPRPTFVADTMARLRRDRQQRWAETLSRYVAPEPSPEFVDRTMAALREDAGAAPEGHGLAAVRGPASRPAPVRSLPMWGLLSAAAAALLWFSQTDPARAPLELRLADQAATAVAYSESTTPMATILSRVAEEEEPYALFDAPADGLWLIGESGEVR